MKWGDDLLGPEIHVAGTFIEPRRKALNFLGSVTAVDNVETGRTDITIGAGGAAATGYSTIQDEGVPRTVRTVLNFIGTGVTVTDDAVGGRTNVTISVAASLPTGTAAGQAMLWNGVAWTAGPVDFADTDATTGELPYTRLQSLGGASRLLGRGSAAGAGSAQDITLGTGLTMTGTVLSASGGIGEITGDVLVSAGSTVANIAAGVIVNADVNASAAIAGTKINPNFGSQGILTTGGITIGGTLHGTTSLSLTSGGDINVGNGDILLETVLIATGQRVLSLVRGSELTTAQMPAGTGDRVVYWADAATLPTASPVGGVLLWSAAGVFSLRNAAGNSAIYGAGHFAITSDDSITVGAGDTLLETSEIAAGRRIVAVLRGSDVTTTQMGAGTGDLVMYVGNAATVPTANAVGGGILYSEGGFLKFRSSSGIVDEMGVVRDNSVTMAKLADLASDRLIGRDTAGTGDPEALTVSGGLEFTGLGGIQRSALTGDILASAGSADTTFRTFSGNSILGRSAAAPGTPGDITATADGQVLQRVGGVLVFGSISAAEIPDGSITNAKIRNSAGLSVIGRATNTTGAPADIVAVTDGHVLRVSGTALGFGTIATAGLADGAVTSAKLATIATDTLMGRDTAGTGAVESITVGGGLEFTGAGAIRKAAVTGDVTVAAGGTVAAFRNFSALSVLGRSAGTSGAPAEIVAGSDGQYLQRVGGALVFAALPAAAIPDDSILDTHLRNSVALSVIGRSVNTTGNPGDIEATATGHVLRRSGSTLGFGQLDTDSLLDGAVTFAKFQNILGLGVLGTTGSAGPIDQIRALADDSVLRRADGAVTFGQIRTGGITDAAVTLPKLASIATDRLLGRDTTGTGAVETISVGGGVEFSGAGGLQRSALTGDVTAPAASGATAFRSFTAASILGRAGATAGAPADIAATADGQVLQRLAGVLTFAALAVTIADGSITDAKLRNSAGISVIGRSANTTGVPADIVAVTDGHVLRLSGTALGFGTIATAGIANNAVTLPKLATVASDVLLGRDTASAGTVEELTVGGGIEFTGAGGIRRSALTGDVTSAAGSTVSAFRSFAALSVLGRSANTGGAPADIAAVTDGHVLRLAGTALGFGTIAAAGIADGAVTLAKQASVATDVLLGRDTTGTGVIETLTVTGGVEFSGAGGIRRSALTGDVTAAVGSNATAFRTFNATSILGRSANSVGIPADIAATADGQYLTRAGGVLTFAALPATVIVDGSITSANLRNSVALSVIGRSANTTGVPADIAAGTDGHVLRRSGTTLGFGTIATAGIADAAVTLAKLQTIATDTILGRETAGTGAVEALTVTGGLEFSGTGSIRRSAISGDITIAAGSNTSAITAGVIVNADVNASAAIAGTKIAPNFGSQNVTTTGHGYFDGIIQTTELVAGRRVSALNRGAALTTTNMGTGTGDLVTFLGECASAPSANPSGGGILYVQSGALKYRSSTGMVYELTGS